jgi:hypothetical protein
MADILDFSLAAVDLRELLKFFDAIGAAKYLASKTPSPIDDFAVNQLADGLREWADSLLEPAPAQLTFAAAPVTPGQIVEAAKALGLTLNPLVISLLLQFAWPVIERLLKRWAK